MKHMPPDWVLDNWWIRCTGLLYRDMCWFFVPLFVRMKGHEAALVGYSLLCGQPFGSDKPANAATWHFMVTQRGTENQHMPRYNNSCTVSNICLGHRRGA